VGISSEWIYFSGKELYSGMHKRLLRTSTGVHGKLSVLLLSPSRAKKIKEVRMKEQIYFS
jgi:hypothetical protein